MPFSSILVFADDTILFFEWNNWFEKKANSGLLLVINWYAKNS